MKLLLLASLCIILTFSACSSVKTSDYAKNTPKLIPQEFFNGDLTAQGVVKDRSGKVTRYFNATIKAYWKNSVGTLEEKFVFNDGEIQYRTWTLTPNTTNSAQFSATAGDVIGTGKGEFNGNSINLNYTLAVAYNNSTLNLAVDDWMWLVDQRTLLNESTLTKFGIKVGSVQLVIQKI